MRLLRNSYFVVMIVIMLSLCTIPIIAAEQQSTSGDNVPSITLDNTLIFDSTHGADSVKTINDKTGTSTCSYNDGNLQFIKSVNISYTTAAADRSLIELNPTGQVSITVNEGVTVSITYNASSMAGTSVYSAISAEHCSDLTILGKGTLRINVLGSSFDQRLNGITTSGRLIISETTLDILTQLGSAVFVNNTYVAMDKCTVRLASSIYGLRIDGTIADVKLYSCNVTASGPNGGMSSRNPAYNLNTSNVSIYVSNNLDGSNKTSSDTPFGYKYCSVENFSFTIGGFEIGGTVLSIAVVAILTIIALIFIFKKRKAAAKDVSMTSDYEPQLPGQPGPVTEERRGYTERNDGNVEISATVTSGDDSFMFIVDGRTYGYVGKQRSVFIVPGGMHKVEIEHNDPSRKSEFSENVLLTNGSEFTIEKRLRGYSVRMK